MALVFVHGVNVRRGDLYDRELAFRNRHFLEVFYQQLGRKVSNDAVFSPYWGDLGANLSADLPFLPRGDYELLWRKKGSAAEPVPEALLRAGEPPEASDQPSKTPLLDIARHASVDEVIDLLWELAEREMIESGAEQRHTQHEMDALAHKALEFAHSPEGEKWLAGLKSDDELLARLSNLLHGTTAAVKSTGESEKVAGRLSDIIKSAGKRLGGRLGESRTRLGTRREALREEVVQARLRMRQSLVATTAHIINEPLRALFHAQCALLIGDAFAYFSTRGDEGQPAPIAQRIIDTLREAAAISQKNGEELIVVGHSMGGVILCDIVTCYGKDIPIDALITVGSQFPLFADLGMFPGCNNVPRPIKRPAQVKNWVNIFDPHDFLGYPASHLFEDVDDYHLPTYAIGGAAHADYFNRRSFYFHLARRMHEYLPPLTVHTG